ncbi:copper amine oxidase N-terminal domain-containing protein [Paenibacillus methanolicus]|uniref:Copper amine oxidase-like protein n=1 Tax=Paenibacillus methanolicus TaxID=582686 RepID=A0A5S5CC30_9BACL|nr:copper amine oxidase N-terminal domain-containing protein [Paenibacillus methanolicus]TYP75553.1 copper amine oxidase-like protein [Paenibacillus methanolicus]
MNNKAMVLSAALLLGVMSAAQAAPVSAKGKQDRVQQEQSADQTETKTTEEATEEAEVTAETDANAEANGEAAVEEVEAEAQEDEAGGKKKKGNPHGLQKAYENTKDKPAGERIAELLKAKYGIDVTAETQAEIEEIVTDLEAKGETEAAEETQAELVAEDPTNVELYVKLGKIKEKNGKKGVKAYVNGSEPNFDVAPVKKDGRVLVPFRAIAEALEAEVAWDAATKTITVSKDGVEVKLTLGSAVAYVNGTEVKLDVPGQTVNNRVLVPLRFLSEALKSNVVWEPETSSVIVNDETATEESASETTTEPVAESTTDAAATTETTTSTEAAAASETTEVQTTTTP